jgi:hypothetical protein
MSLAPQQNGSLWLEADLRLLIWHGFPRVSVLDSISGRLMER